MTTPWKRLLPSSQQVTNLVWSTKIKKGHLNKLSSQACLSTTTQRSLLTELTRLTWRSWLRYKTISAGLKPSICVLLAKETISAGLNLQSVFFFPGAHPEGPRHLELGSTGWDFFHQEPGTNTVFLYHNQNTNPTITSLWAFFFRASVEAVLPLQLWQSLRLGE